MTSGSDKLETMRLTSRGYELAQTGVLPLSQYLRYLEHQRWTTIGTSKKLPMRRFFTMGVVRAQGLEIEEHVGFGEELELTVWLSRLGRTSFDFSHDVVRASDGKRVARSTATVVALDASRRPAPLPDEAQEYVLSSRQGLPLDRLAFEVPEGAYRRSLEVRPSDQDLQRHVNHARYADFVEDTRYFAQETGAYGPGVPEGFPRSFFLAYEREAKVGDATHMATWAPSPGILEFAMTKDGTIATRARISL
jgi:acyl-CoA thioesterase FadM